jgi:site-specific DNA-methyltransferase (adenine-specific)
MINEIIEGNSEIKLCNINDEFIDLTITSPPYDNLRNYNSLFNIKVICKELYRVTRNGGIIVWIISDSYKNGSETGTSYEHILAFMEAGFKLHDTMIYEKMSSSYPSPVKGKRYSQIFEFMWVFSKGIPLKARLLCDKPNKWAGYTNWGKNTNRMANGALIETNDIKPVAEYSPRNNIWKYTVGSGFGTKDKNAHKHPAVFPELLVSDHIMSWSEIGDIVLDPFSGSGTTCIQAKKYGRNYIGIEIDSEYVKLSKKRLEDIIKLNDVSFETYQEKLRQRKFDESSRELIKNIVISKKFRDNIPSITNNLLNDSEFQEEIINYINSLIETKKLNPVDYKKSEKII